MEELLEEDAAWIVDTVMAKLVSRNEPDEAMFLVNFCQVFHVFQLFSAKSDLFFTHIQVYAQCRSI